MMRDKKGITLVALVITIIVLLILAGITISMMLGNNGILKKATDARTNTNNEQIKEKIQLAYHSALTNGEGTYTKKSLEEELEKEFGENNYNVDDSDDTHWVLSSQGQNVIISAGVKDPRIAEVLNNLKVGANLVGYNPAIAQDGSTIQIRYVSKGSYTSGTSGRYGDGTTGNGYSDQAFTVNGDIVNWIILGQENGQILIMPADEIKTETNKKMCFRGQSGYACYVDELNKISSLYGLGKYADTSKFSVNIDDTTISSGARSINAEDLKNLGYNAPEVSQVFTKTKSTVFKYWDEHVDGSKTWKSLTKIGSSVTLSNKTQIISKGENVTANIDEIILNKSDGSEADYFLASRYLNFVTGSGYIGFAVHNVAHRSFYRTNIFNSNNTGLNNYAQSGIRPVVYLDKNVILEYDENSNTYYFAD